MNHARLWTHIDEQLARRALGRSARTGGRRCRTGECGLNPAGIALASAGRQHKQLYCEVARPEEHVLHVLQLARGLQRGRAQRAEVHLSAQHELVCVMWSGDVSHDAGQ